LCRVRGGIFEPMLGQRSFVVGVAREYRNTAFSIAESGFEDSNEHPLIRRAGSHDPMRIDRGERLTACAVLLAGCVHDHTRVPASAPSSVPETTSVPGPYQHCFRFPYAENSARRMLQHEALPCRKKRELSFNNQETTAEYRRARKYPADPRVGCLDNHRQMRRTADQRLQTWLVKACRTKAQTVINNR
jgi:hypothetical protein